MKRDTWSILLGIWGEGCVEKPECTACYAGISALVDAELDAEDMQKPLVSVLQHLASCQACQEEYQELKTLLRAERRGELNEPPSPPDIDFSYLGKSPSINSVQPAIKAPIQSLHRGISCIHVLAERLLILLFRRANIQDTRMQPASFTSTRLTSKTYRLALPIQTSELQVGLLLGFPSHHNAAVGVQLTWAESGLPAERIQVDVRDLDKRLLDSILTSVDGRASFPQVTAGDYMLEVRHRDAVLQVPFALQTERQVI